MNKTRLLVFVIIISLLAGCSPAKSTARGAFISPAGDAPQAWVDAPLDGMRIPLAPYEFVAHGTAAAGVIQLEWILNGASLGGTAAEGRGKLATFRYNWTPPGGGSYTLQVRAQDGKGAWSETDQVTFTVGEPTPTFTVTPTLTLTPEIPFTATATHTATPTMTPTPMAGELIFSPGFSTNQFYYGSCSPNSVEIAVLLSTTENVKHVELYLRLLDQNSSQSTDWDSYAVMSSQGGGSFWTLVKASQVPGANKFDKATLLYQFVVIGKNGKVLTRSESFNDISLNKCGYIFLQPQITLLPVEPIKTPFIIK